MPIYQYKCRDCGHQMEALQKMSDPKLEDCPACGAPALRKQLTAAAFSLKGTGWYATDFKNSGNKPTTGKDASGKATTSGSESSTDQGAPASDAPSQVKDKASSSTGASS